MAFSSASERWPFLQQHTDTTLAEVAHGFAHDEGLYCYFEEKGVSSFILETFLFFYQGFSV